MTPLEVRKGSTYSITLNVISFMQMEKIEESLFFIMCIKELWKDTQESGYQWARNQKRADV